MIRTRRIRYSEEETMTTTCAGCGGEAAHLDNNFGEFWFGIPTNGKFSTQFDVLCEDQTVSIVGHQKLYFCADCLRAAQQNCIEPQNALDLYAISLRSAGYRYFTRKDFAQLKFEKAVAATT
jgi:hypothetical protein